MQLQKHTLALSTFDIAKPQSFGLFHLVWCRIYLDWNESLSI